jgi:hypothetical protein
MMVASSAHDRGGMTIDEIVLDGRESALLVAALFILDCWAFEADDARVMIDGLDRGATDKVATEIAARWRHSLEAHQLWDSPTRICTQ